MAWHGMEYRIRYICVGDIVIEAYGSSKVCIISSIRSLSEFV